jgi:hypothetical protein
MLNDLLKFEMACFYVNDETSESICPKQRGINVKKIKVFRLFYCLFYFYFNCVILLITNLLKLLIYN